MPLQTVQCLPSRVLSCVQALLRQQVALEAAGRAGGFAADAPGWADAAAALAGGAAHARGVLGELRALARGGAAAVNGALVPTERAAAAGAGDATGSEGAPVTERRGDARTAAAHVAAQGPGLHEEDEQAGVGPACERAGDAVAAAAWTDAVEAAVEALLLWAQALPPAPPAGAPYTRSITVPRRRTGLHEDASSCSWRARAPASSGQKHAPLLTYKAVRTQRMGTPARPGARRRSGSSWPCWRRAPAAAGWTRPAPRPSACWPC